MVMVVGYVPNKCVRQRKSRENSLEISARYNDKSLHLMDIKKTSEVPASNKLFYLNHLLLPKEDNYSLSL